MDRYVQLSYLSTYLLEYLQLFPYDQATLSYRERLCIAINRRIHGNPPDTNEVAFAHSSQEFAIAQWPVHAHAHARQAGLFRVAQAIGVHDADVDGFHDVVMHAGKTRPTELESGCETRARSRVSHGCTDVHEQ